GVLGGVTRFASRAGLRFDRNREPICFSARGARARAQVKLPLQASETACASLPPRLTVIGLTSPGCARRNFSAALSCAPTKGSCNGRPPVSQGQPPTTNVTVDSPGQP